MSRWLPPEGVASLAPLQRVAFGLVCAEHLYPSLERQARAQPAALASVDLSIADFRDCLDAMWAWVAGGGDGPPPDCITGQHADEAELGQGAEELGFLVADAVAALWSARTAYEDPEGCIASGWATLESAGALVEELLGPRPAPSSPGGVREESQVFIERREAVATHELVELVRSAQAEAVAALANGSADAVELREPAQAVGARIAEWTAQVL